MTADLHLKERALAQVEEHKVKGFRYKPSNDILHFLVGMQIFMFSVNFVKFKFYSNDCRILT